MIYSHCKAIIGIVFSQYIILFFYLIDGSNCINTVGSFICECNTGYELNDDLITCTGMYSVLPRIFRVVVGF